MSATTNRITDPGYSYDANGNMTNDGLNALAYDAENRLVTSSGSTYSNDGSNLRVKKVSGSTTTVYVFSGAKVIAEYVNGALPTAPTKEYVYSGTALLATIAGSTTTYHHADHLSVRLTTDTGGNALAQQGHFPFGESWYQGSGGTKWQFTSYERDAESGNDYAMFRFHVNRLARFSSPDPIAGSVADPQSLNRYPYVLNDPGNLVDPLGLRMSLNGCGALDSNCGGGGSAGGGILWIDFGTPFLSVDYGDGRGIEWGIFTWQFFPFPGGGFGGDLGGDQGGRDVNLTFAATFKCNLNSTQVTKALQNNFAYFSNYSSSKGYIVFPPGPLTPGQRIRIDTTLNVPPRALVSQEVRVDVRSNSQTSFSFEAVQGHHFFYPGTITFSSTDAGSGQINFSVNVSATFANLWTRLGFHLGGQQFEKDVWNHLIQGIRDLCAGAGTGK